MTTRELFDYVRPNVEREARKKNVEQTPTLRLPSKGRDAVQGQVWIRLR